MNADEMFEKLEYKKMITTQDSYLECGYIGENHNRIFFTKNKTLNGKLCEDLTIQELQAINKKVEEMGWNE